MARKKAAEGSKQSRLTPKNARNAVGVAKIIGPAVLPVLAPLAVRAAGVAREAYDRYQARRIGVPVERLSEFTGRGAALRARIAGLADGLADLRAAQRATADDRKFADDTQGTLEQLAASVRAAERMPAARRKAAHRAVAGELDRLEGQLLQRLGV
ncbi:DUF6474 family protein [Amycolatopsis anabasis]|uniref:DUF6474 family protein n=1 Tax=Amycolatopsis anabasis TaxID=1840409 RepID=UPI00131AF502|nr:DUF6474 family protein [Amycolatopsis anabasis]